LPSGSSSIGCISVPANTTLTVDVDYSFSGTTFVTSGYSRIVVDPTIQLTLQNNCDLISCDGGAWHIFLQPGSVSPASSGGLLDMSNSEIKGGVTANHLSRIRLVSNQFKGGSSALVVNGYVSFIHLEDPFDFNNNSFVGYYNPIYLNHAYSFSIGSQNSTSPAIVNYISEYGATGSSSHTSGILVENCLNIGIFDVDISGYFVSSKNDDRKAIWLNNCRNISIERCNIHPSFPGFGLPGFGIHGKYIFGSLNIRNNSITSRSAGIYMENGFAYNQCNITGNTIYSQEGVGIQEGRDVDLTINDNHITHYYGGSITSTPGGILLFKITGSYDISENTIEEQSNLFDNSYGWGDYIRNISISTCTADGKISDNTIKYPVSLIATGISINTSENVAVVENSMTGQLHDVNQGHGIDVLNSTNIYFCCNSVDSTDYGTRFSSANNDIKYLTTTFGVHDTALYFPPAASVNKQNNTGNTWAGSITNLDAYYNGSVFQAQSNAPFRTNASNINASKISPPSWFFFSGSDPSCSGETYPCVETLPNDSLTQLTDDDLLALAEPEADNEYVLRFEQQRLLYRKLKEHPEFIEWNEDVTTFYEDADTKIIGAFDAIDEDFRRFSQISSGLFQSFAVLHHEIDSLSALVSSIFVQYPSASSSEQIELQEDLQKFTDQIVTAQYELDTLFAQANTEMQENLTQLLEDNDAISVTETWEENEKEINILFFKYLGGVIDSFTNQEKEDIIALANACPQYEGAGVYKARLLRGTFADSTFAGYFEYHCLPSESKSVKIQSIDNTENGLFIYPNPASDMISIRFGEPTALENQVVIRDLLGRTFLSKNVSGVLETNLDIANIPSGVYLISFHSDLLFPISRKLIISR